MTKQKRIIKFAIERQLRGYNRRYPAWGNLREAIIDRPMTNFRLQSIMDHCSHTGDRDGFNLLLDMNSFDDSQWDEFLNLFGETLVCEI